jgi:inhibitor of cysteine peptidase
MRSARLIGAIAQLVVGVSGDMALAQSPASAVTIIDDGSGGAGVEVRLGQELQLDLAANPTTGYTWRCDLADSGRVRMKSRRFQPSPSGSPPRLGAGGTERFVFETAAAGSERLHFEYRRDQTGQPARTYDLTVTVLP